MSGQHLHSVSLHQNRTSVGVLSHGLLQALGEILLMGRVLDDGNPEGVEEAQHALTLATRNTLDLLDIADLEAAAGSLFALDQERHQNRPLRMSVDAATGASFKGCEEERRACGGFQAERLADILAIGWRVFGSGKFKDEDVVWLDQLLLDTRRRNEDMVPATDGGLYCTN